MPRRDWFEISHEGWRRRSRARSLGRLLLEAVQNAFDAEAATVAVDLEPGRVRVEDDARDGLSDERLVYTV